MRVVEDLPDREVLGELFRESKVALSLLGGHSLLLRRFRVFPSCEADNRCAASTGRCLHIGFQAMLDYQVKIYLANEAQAVRDPQKANANDERDEWASVGR